jgi:hypothetical protein
MKTNSDILDKIQQIIGEYQHSETDGVLVIGHAKDDAEDDYALGSIAGTPLTLIAAIVHQMYDNDNICFVLTKAVSIFHELLKNPKAIEALDGLKDTGQILSHINKSK